MADPTAFYEPEEDELLSSLAVPSYQGAAGANYEDEYRRIQQLEQHAYAQQIAAAQEAELEQSQLLELVPEDVKRVSHIPQSLRAARRVTLQHAVQSCLHQFLILFHQAILENDLPTITSMYESGWNKLTQVCTSQRSGTPSLTPGALFAS